MIEAAVETWSALHIERSLQGPCGRRGDGGPAMLGLTMALGRFFRSSCVANFFRRQKVIIAATLVAIAGAVLSAFGPSAALGSYRILVF
jgi:hypothetical protein